MSKDSTDDLVYFDLSSSSADAENQSRRMLNIDFRLIQEKGFISPFASRSQVAEEYRIIKRPLLKYAFLQGADAIEKGNVLMVTSANPGEGKTFNAFNLALSISMEKDKTVLLIDADIVKASLSAFLGVKDERGLVDYLLDDDIELRDVLFGSNVANLSVIPAGRADERTTELLASNSMAKLMKELSTRYPDRVIVMDAPPLLMTSESIVLSELVGQVVFIVESAETPQSDVQDALHKLPADAHVSFILNKSKRKQSSSYYGSKS